MAGIPNLMRLRVEAGLTRRALGAMLKDKSGQGAPVTDKTIFNWETGARRPNSDDLRSLAQALGVQPGDLLNQPAEPAEGAA